MKTTIIISLAAVLLLVACQVPAPPEGKCMQTQRGAPCAREYVPVCGNNGMTYTNKCLACTSNEVTTYVAGECPTGPAKQETFSCQTTERNGTCTKEFVPVCADNGMTYANKCIACHIMNITTYVTGACKQ